MLLKRATPFDSEEHLFEVKWDGTRGIALIGVNTYRLLSRHEVDMSGCFPELGFLRKLKPGTVLDGEVVVLRDGKPNFSLLLSRLGIRSKLKARMLSRSTPATYVVFDQLYENYNSLMALPFWKRRERLTNTVEVLGEPGLVISEGIRGDGRRFFEEVSSRGLEGVVSKHIESRYSAGKRSSAWLKIKRRGKLVCAVVGYVPRGREGFQSLIVASDVGGELRFVGRVSRGFDDEVRARLGNLLRSRTSNCAIVPCAMKGKWVKPGIYLKVSYLELTARGELRFPVFERLLEG